MIKSQILMTVLCISALVWHQAQTKEPTPAKTFDIITFSPPQGWRSDDGKDHITFTKIDNEKRVFCMLGIYRSQSGTGDLAKDFASEWKDIVLKSFTAEASPSSKEHRTHSGLRLRDGGAAVRQNGKESYGHLLVLSAGQRVISVLVVASNRSTYDSFRDPVDAFIESLSLVKGTPGLFPQGASQPAATTTSKPATTWAPKSPKDAGSFRGGGIAGVWMGFKTLYETSEPSPRWITFFDDGQSFDDIPLAGLAGCDRRESKSDEHQKNYWGKYDFRDGVGVINKPGVRNPTRITSERPDQIKLDNDSYYRCAEVDGLRLEGSWTSFANPSDPDLVKLPNGHRPVFRFRKDGRFTDEGVFASFLHSYTEPRQDDGGSGTYLVKDFTLILRYSDGRVHQVAITGFLRADPATANDTFYIARARFRKMK